jgi:surface protein
MKKIIETNSLNIKCLINPNNKKSIKIYKNIINDKFIKENKRTFSIKYKYNNNLIFSKRISKINIRLNIFIYLLLTIFFTNSVFTKKIMLRKDNNKDSEIVIKIKGTGTQNIINKDFNDIPNEIMINGVIQNYTGKSVNNLVKNINTIKMKWNYMITNCSFMFSELNNIIEIEFINFDFSKVNDTTHMFEFCYSLKSINFNNISTPSLKNTQGMFLWFISLTTVNLSNFNTSLVTNM